MRKSATVFAAALSASFIIRPASAQKAESEPTAEEMIDAAREAYRPPGLLRRCPQGEPGEIVVCAPDPDAYRVESPTAEAIRTGDPVADGIPRAPDVFGLAPCNGGCMKMGATPPQVHLIDLSKIPHPLSEEEAAMVFREEDATPPEAGGVAAP